MRGGGSNEELFLTEPYQSVSVKGRYIRSDCEGYMNQI